jgi:hypothetical protein
MDPDTALEWFLDACREQERETALDAIEWINDWLAKGGAMPRDPRLPKGGSNA